MLTIRPIAFVKNIRKKAEDDYWGNIRSDIVLIDSVPAEALKGIEDFSHIEIIFYFHLAPPENSVNNLWMSHPRDNAGFPEVGIFSQRRKSRPNSLGTTIVKIIGTANKTLKVSGLDAIDGTPVIDIKPVMREFLPAEDVIQPDWSLKVMENYWSEKNTDDDRVPTNLKTD